MATPGQRRGGHRNPLRASGTMTPIIATGWPSPKGSPKIISDAFKSEEKSNPQDVRRVKDFFNIWQNN